MANPRELDLLTRSLNGDWRSRVDFFKKYIWDNERVRRLGGAYRQQDDFLHDCFTNVLRTGHSLDEEQSLNEWVISVAAWTALERQRMRDIDALGATGRIRMCAGIEGDEPENRARLASYVPPRSGPKDSLASRLAALIGEPQFTIMSKRALENATWEETAAAAGKPLNTIGPALVRTLTRMTRFFGAPPPLDADLEPVFSRFGGQDTAAKSAGAEKLKGRLVAMQLDSSFYSLTPEWRRIGLNVPTDVRTLVLWEAARAKTAPGEELRGHLAKCSYCADLLRAMLLLQRAFESSSDADFLLCPGGFTLLNTPEQVYDKFDQHLVECSACREEHARVVAGEEEAASSVPEIPAAGDGKISPLAKALAVAAAAIVLLGGSYFMFRRVNVKEKAPESSSVSFPKPVIIPDIPTVSVDPRYKDLAQPISVGDKRWLASVLPANVTTFNEARGQFAHGLTAAALPTMSMLGENDPGAQMLYAVGLYQQNALSDAYYAMLKSEVMTPRNSFRCWTMLQCALIVGDIKVVEREVDHLSSDPEYAARAKALLEKARARK